MGLTGRRLVAGLALCLLVALSGCSGFTPSDYVVCQSCSHGIDYVGGENLSVESSSLVIALQGDGSSRWTVRSRLAGPTLDELQADPALARDIGQNAVLANLTQVLSHSAFREPHPLHHHRVTNLTVRLDDDTMVLRFRADDTAVPSSDGTLLVDLFHIEDPRTPNWVREHATTGWTLGTDRVVLRAPPGREIPSAPDSATRVNDSAIAWSHDTISGRTYIGVTPEDQAASGVAVTLAIVLAILSWAPEQVVGTSLSGVLLVGFVVFGFAPKPAPTRAGIEAWLDRDSWRPEWVGVASVLVTVVCLAFVPLDPFWTFVLAGLAVACGVFVYERAIQAGSTLSRPLGLWLVSIPVALTARYVVAPAQFREWLFIAVFVWAVCSVFVGTMFVLGERVLTYVAQTG